MSDVKIVRLVSGEDVIAYFEEDEDYVLLGSPMCVFFKRLQSGKSMMMMSPWIPMEIVEDDIISIHASQILTVMNPKKHISDYYKQMIFDVENDLDLDESLRDASPTDDELNAVEEEQLQEFFDSFNSETTTKQTIH